MALPHCDTLFMTYFDPWYEDSDREKKVFPATRPDLIQNAVRKKTSARKLSTLTATVQASVLKQINGMVEAAEGDWPGYLRVRAPIDVQWITAFDAYYTKKNIVKLIQRSDPEDYSNDYLVTACEFGAVIGHVMLALKPRLFWVPAWPYWESSICDPKSGTIIPPFHWAIKKLSSYGVDDGFREKMLSLLKMLDTK